MESEDEFPHYGWRSRGFIPHFERENLVQSITYRLADSMPQSVLLSWKRDLQDFPEDKRNEELVLRAQEYLDAGYGKCVPRQDECAEIAESKLLERDGFEYMLIAWVIMPNHVHVLAEFADDAPMDRIIQKWKGGSSIQINRILGRSGRLWQVEYFDRYIRSPLHLANEIRYIENNPAKAKLVEVDTDFRWSSARLRA